MKNIFTSRTIFTVFITSLFFSSCIAFPIFTDPYLVNESRQKENIYYVPSAPNTHLLSEKNDINVNLVSSAGTKFSGTEVQASYLPGKHIGIVSSYSYAHNQIYMKYNSFEIGGGYVTKLSKGWHFETYAGMGSGNILNQHYTGSSHISLSHFFVQPAIAISNQKKTVQLGFISKFSGVHFKVDTAFNNDREPFNTTQVKILYDKSFHLMWEPGLVFRIGWKNFLFHTSYSFSSDLTNAALYKANNNFSIGASLRLNTSRRKNN